MKYLPDTPSAVAADDFTNLKPFCSAQIRTSVKSTALAKSILFAAIRISYVQNFFSLLCYVMCYAKHSITKHNITKIAVIFHPWVGVNFLEA